MFLILVESPTKAKAINEYLKSSGGKYKALSTFGHIRELVPKSGSIDKENGYKFKWEMTKQWAKNKKELLDSAKKADEIIMASDPDREGEGIAWHTLEVLKEHKINKPTHRIVFHSVSKKAIEEAIDNKQELRKNLVEAYLARLGLDYIFGFSVSPVLWRRIPCCKSAGRVQSAALRMVVERENEILKFVSEKYISIHAKFAECTKESTLIELAGEKFENGNIFKKQIDVKSLEKGPFIVKAIEKQKQKQKAPAPFITSTLQQEASSQLGFPPSLTMQLAQKLYEGFTINGKHQGLITYMRTDNVGMSADGIKAARSKIQEEFGNDYLPSKPNMHKQKVRNAQEAHEAVRPVDFNLTPKTLSLGDKNLEALYKLIWKKSLASQMSDAEIEKTNIKIEGNQESIFQIKGNKITFPGFKILQEKEAEIIDFSNIKEGSTLTLEEMEQKDHETKAPGRFSEASLIQNLEKLGIGRPSTYARIIQVLYEREYAVREKKTIMPTQKGWIVVAFLKNFFKEYIQYEFTANLESSLDESDTINNDHKNIIKNFWDKLEEKIELSKNISPMEVSKALEEEYSEYFKAKDNKCKECEKDLVLKISRFGALRGCSNYPDCKGIVSLNGSEEEDKDKQAPFEMEINSQKVILKSGPYGPYIEILGEKVKRVPIPKLMQKSFEEMSKEDVEFLISLPKKIGEYEGKDILIGIGKFGPYIKYESSFISIKNPMEIDQEEAIEKIINKPEKKVFKKAAPKTSAKKVVKKATKKVTKKKD